MDPVTCGLCQNPSRHMLVVKVCKTLCSNQAGVTASTQLLGSTSLHPVSAACISFSSYSCFLLWLVAYIIHSDMHVHQCLVACYSQLCQLCQVIVKMELQLNLAFCHSLPTDLLDNHAFGSSARHLTTTLCYNVTVTLLVSSDSAP